MRGGSEKEGPALPAMPAKEDLEMKYLGHFMFWGCMVGYLFFLPSEQKTPAAFLLSGAIIGLGISKKNE